MYENCKNGSCINCFHKSPIFSLMSNKELEAIQETRYEVVYAPDEIIYKQGNKTTQIVSITGGLVKTYVEGFNHKNYILELIRPTTVIAGPGTYVDNKHHFSLKAVEETNCCFFDLNVFKTIVLKNSKLSDFLLHIISKKSILYYEKFLSLTQKHVNGRIAENLIYLNTYIYPENPMELTISYHDIAEMTGMTKDTVVRVFKDLCTEKIIEITNNIIKILNMDKLVYLSEWG